MLIKNKKNEKEIIYTFDKFSEDTNFLYIGLLRRNNNTGKYKEIKGAGYERIPIPKDTWFVYETFYADFKSEEDWDEVDAYGFFYTKKNSKCLKANPLSCQINMFEGCSLHLGISCKLELE